MLQEKIQEDALEARKAGNKVSSALLVTLSSEIFRIGKDAGNRRTTDEEAIRVVKKFKDGVVESLNVISDQERKAILTEELKILQSYLPAELTEEQLGASIKELVGELQDRSMKSIGVVMAGLKKKHGSAFDGSTASRLIKSHLQ